MNFKELSIQCRTYRRFQQKPIDPAILQELMENVRIISSAMNGQVLRYVLVKDPSLVKELQPAIHWAAALPKELGTPKEGEQPVAFILVCKEGRGNPWDDIDAGMAVRNIALNACAYGIGSAILGAVEWNKVKDILSVPDNWNPTSSWPWAILPVKAISWTCRKTEALNTIWMKIKTTVCQRGRSRISAL